MYGAWSGGWPALGRVSNEPAETMVIMVIYSHNRSHLIYTSPQCWSHLTLLYNDQGQGGAGLDYTNDVISSPQQ